MKEGEQRIVRVQSKEQIRLKKWADDVKHRDRRCRRTRCGVNYNLHAHHIMPKQKYPKLRTHRDNGVTLCGNCHSLITGKEERVDICEFLGDDKEIARQLTILEKILSNSQIKLNRWGGWYIPLGSTKLYYDGAPDCAIDTVSQGLQSANLYLDQIGIVSIKPWATGPCVRDLVLSLDDSLEIRRKEMRESEAKVSSILHDWSCYLYHAKNGTLDGWGKWRMYSKTLLIYDGLPTYAINFEMQQIFDTQEVLGWIVDIAVKEWAVGTCVRDLVIALNSILDIPINSNRHIRQMLCEHNPKGQSLWLPSWRL